MITPVIPHAGDEDTIWPTILTLGREFGGTRMLIGDDSGLLRQESLPRNFTVYPGPRRGFAANVNQLAEKVTTDWMLLVNNDVELHRGSGRQLRTYVKYADRKVGLVATSVWRPDGTLDSFGDTFSWLLGRPLKRGRGTQDVVRAARLPLLSVSGAVMLVKMEMWRQLNGLDEGFAQYYEDVDFGWRAIEQRWRLDELREANSTHNESQTFAAADKAFFGTRNNLWLIRRHCSSDPGLLENAVKSWRFKAKRSAPAISEAITRGLEAGLNDDVPPAPSPIERTHRVSLMRPTIFQEALLVWSAWRRRSF